MRLYERFSSKLQRTSSKKPTKWLSTGTAILVLTALLWMSIATQEKPQGEVVEIDSPSTIEQAFEFTPRGLSRRRQGFDKALGILASAASSDRHLSGYFTRAQKRVWGEATSPENGSGVFAVKRDRKTNHPVELKKLSSTDASLAVPGRTRIKNVWAKLKRFFSRRRVEDSRKADNSQTIPSTESASRVMTPEVTNREHATSSIPLTVGDMTFDTNSAIERWVNYYTASRGGRQTMQIGIDRSGSYLNLARTEFRHQGVPEDLVWVAQVESVWNMSAMSPAAACGLWQFIPTTATDYGLTVSRERDERLDPVKQTRAAATYLRDLYTIFGDWALALAAYNCGEARVMGAIVKNGRANFWEMHQKQLLPQETLNYVPKILAAIKVASRAESYGFSPEAQPETSFAAD